ncbi:hypothetical protein GCM10027590_54620 [Nocardiopsis nanhaiensis]
MGEVRSSPPARSGEGTDSNTPAAPDVFDTPAALERALHGIRDFADKVLEGEKRNHRGAVFSARGGERSLDGFLAEAGSGPIREIRAAPSEAKGFHSALVHRRIRSTGHEVDSLLTESAALGLSVWEKKLLRPGGQRVTGHELPASLLLGERSGLIMAAAWNGAERFLLVRDEDILGLLNRMFQFLWVEAIDLSLFHRQAWDDDICDQVLLCLAQGLKDEVAARRLDISVRTYRRYVADLLRRLDATSRFQAGYQVARRGLVPGRLLRSGQE